MNRAQFEFEVAADHPSLAGHFPGRPIVPGVVLVDCVFDAVNRLTNRQIGRVLRVKFTSPLLPGERAEGSFEFDTVRVAFSVATSRGGTSVVLAEGVASFATEVVA